MEALIISAREMTQKEQKSILCEAVARSVSLFPPHFQSIAETAEFWDSHDLTEYWDLTRKASFEVDIQRRVFLTALEPGLAKKLTDCAHKQGVSTETLINVWLTEKVTEAT